MRVIMAPATEERQGSAAWLEHATENREGGARDVSVVTPCARSPLDFSKKARTGDTIRPEGQFSET